MALLAIGGALGCSSSGGVEVVSSCELADVCAALTVDDVAAACDSSVSSSEYTGYPAGPNTPNAVDRCEYTGEAGPTYAFYRICYPLTRDALADYVAERDPQLGGLVTETIDGIGDGAFFRYGSAMTETRVVVLDGNHLIRLVHNGTVDVATDKSCLTTLAGVAVPAGPSP
jgi:hypothetical protein